MNEKLTSMPCFIMLACLAQPLCADSFENLDFEDVVIDGPLELPFWETSAEGLIYNTLCLGSICTSIHDEESDFFQPLQGNYSVHLDAGSNIGDFDHIWQIGTVPNSATRLTMLVDIPDPDTFQVAFDSTPLTLLSQSPNQRWAYDISPFAGATGELKISARAINGFNESALIDDIQFIPEPSTAIFLAGLGAAFTMRRRRRW